MIFISQILNQNITGLESLFSPGIFNLLQAQSPTPIPMIIPPSAGPNWIQLMVGVALIAVLIVIVGVWINRKEYRQ